MIGIAEYNETEALAREAAPALHGINQWGNVQDLHNHLCVVRELNQLQILLNRFQCDRYRTYIYELGGLSREDLTFFAYIRGKLLEMQRRHYAGIPPTVPVETMLSAMTLHARIRAARPTATTILEIGPGAGLNALFMSCDLLLKNYTQIEATQATYLSQAMVNDVCYGPERPEIWEAARSDVLQPPIMAPLWHIPWWRVDDLYDQPVSYDVITANACLNEISDEQVLRYLELFKAKSHSDTILVVQDLGDWMYRNDQLLLEMLEAYGWRLNGAVNNWEIEEAVGECGHGDAVCTWWLTKNRGESIPRLKRRCDTGAATLMDGEGNPSRNFSGRFRIPGDDRVWGREELANGLVP
jgi:hypothetical protein